MTEENNNIENNNIINNQMNLINCSYCHQDKTPESFYKGHKTCKDCVKLKNKTRYSQKRETYLTTRRKKKVKDENIAEPEQKLCNGCGEYYLLSEFDAGKKKCKTCRSLYNKERYARRRDSKQKQQLEEQQPVNDELSEVIRAMFVTALNEHVKKIVTNALTI
jgi:hypothetical protein